MTVREFLEQGIRLQEKIDAGHKECSRLQKLAEGLQSPGFDPHYGSGSSEAPFEKTVEKLADMQKKLQEDIQLWKLLNVQIVLLLEEVPDPETRRMLQLHYLEGMNWLQVQKEVARSESGVMRIVKNALQKLNVPPDAIDLSKRSEKN